MSQVRKAVALISGGLDSMLATKLIQQQGVHVEGINFFTGFCVEGHTHAIRKKDQNKEKRNNALWVAEQLGIKLHIVDIVEPYKDVVLNPKHGYGANLNPCQDCKTFMIGQAMHWMKENGFDFIITGEVVGQRPKSQRLDLMPVIARESGANDLLVRPLCAKLLPPTLPERAGWIDREKLYDLSGRSRKPQMEMASQFGFDEYSQPAGGCCFLTDENYTARLTDLWTARHKRDYDLDDILLLKVGRHIRPSPNFKLIVGREEGENRYLEGYRKQFIHLRALDAKGPLVLIDGEVNADDLLLAARITARYCQARDQAEVAIEVTQRDASQQTLTVSPMATEQIPAAWHI